MKTKFLAAVIATCFAAPVMAQSSVTIYGIADAGLMKQSGQTLRVVSGIADGSRLGFKGSEDIGGGFKAIFNLEARVELDSGSQKPTLLSDEQGLFLTRGMGAGFNSVLAPLGPLGGALSAGVLQSIRGGFQVKGSAAVNAEGALFDRTSMVGLITPFGAFLMGRMYTPGYEVFAASDVFESGTAGAWGGITGGTAGFTNLGVEIRSSKSIQYRIATPAGLGGSLMYGTKGSGYLNRYNKFYGAAATYKANGFDVGVAHNRGYDQSDRTSLVTSTIGGSYTMGEFKFFAGYHDQRNRNSVLLADYTAGYNAQIAPGIAAQLVPAGPLAPVLAAGMRTVFLNNIGANTQLDAASYQVGLHYRVGAGRVMASVAHQNDRSNSDSDANLFALGYDYNLSKRTDIYTVVAQINNKNEGQFIPGAAGSPGGFAKVPGSNARAVQVGIRHRF
ncbi:porin [Massilia psychrophila]|uniref:Porin n=1 Tax=Massilia psychrophila TaxID=1603353 RepID=A0A2G8SXQ0_9BURK|nr:porin [Massilia psychrophila]PIL38565.1 porin [Massilia psychrophila]GGE86293.1 porin [Massilia psychrophila]